MLEIADRIAYKSKKKLCLNNDSEQHLRSDPHIFGSKGLAGNGLN